MTKRELIDYCLTYPATFEDYPFDETAAVMKHNGNGKMFALIDFLDGNLFINLKCDPVEADFFRNVYQSVTPAWHMNKTHWNTIYISGDVPEDQLNAMIRHSFDLTKPKARKEKGSNKFQE